MQEYPARFISHDFYEKDVIIVILTDLMYQAVDGDEGFDSPGNIEVQLCKNTQPVLFLMGRTSSLSS
jgi:hypothetical protein